MGSQIFTHPPLNQEVHAIGGYYLPLKEGEICVHGRRVLYLLCQANLDNTCCGVGGGMYIQVAGFVLRSKFTCSEEGTPLSEVEPIRDTELQDTIREMLQKGEKVAQIYFI